MPQVVGIRFKTSGKIYYFDPIGFTLSLQDSVIVETANGNGVGVVAQLPVDLPEEKVVTPLKKVIRMATEGDRKQAEANQERAKKAIGQAMEKVNAHKLDMRIVDAEYAFDQSKVIFFFTADGRIDFRELVKDLASIFRTRVELRQIGVRDKAKMVGGLGCCGRPLCCATFLEDFEPVSIKMAKEQDLSLNPLKISGVCSRLMCCLKYENEVYKERNKERKAAVALAKQEYEARKLQEGQQSEGGNGPVKPAGDQKIMGGSPMNQPKPPVTQPRPQMSQPKPPVAQPRPQMSQPKTPVTQPRTQMNQATPQVNQPRPQMSQPTPQVNQPRPQMNQPTPQMSQPTPQVNQPRTQMNQPISRSDQRPTQENSKPRFEERPKIQNRPSFQPAKEEGLGANDARTLRPEFKPRPQQPAPIAVARPEVPKENADRKTLDTTSPRTPIVARPQPPVEKKQWQPRDQKPAPKNAPAPSTPNGQEGIRIGMLVDTPEGGGKVVNIRLDAKQATILLDSKSILEFPWSSLKKK